MDELHFKVALNAIPRMGPLLIRRLISYVGSVEGVFREKKKYLEKIPGIGTVKAAGFNTDQALKEAEREVEYIQKHGIIPLFYLDRAYPERLRECEDGPVMLYVKGEVDLNAGHVISIVGTRHATAYGREMTRQIIGDLAAGFPDLLIVSGLAFGIDITAHKEALDNQLITVAVLGHGFEYMYPSDHLKYARKIARQGALVTEFHSFRKPDPGNFISRNRIIAGLADATLIVESAEKGGALITADLANSYNRDVFAIPGRTGDLYSRGCNLLIRKNMAALVECGKDIEQAMGWITESERPKIIQKQLFYDLNPEEQSVLSFLERKGDMALDMISQEMNIPVSKLSALLLELEFKGFIRALPGKYYCRN